MGAAFNMTLKLSSVGINNGGKNYISPALRVLTGDLTTLDSTHVRFSVSGVSNTSGVITTTGTIVNAGSGYTSVPTADFIETTTSPIGKISAVAVMNGGFGYTRIPYIDLPDTTSIPGKVAGYSDSIGKIQSVRVADVGVEYNIEPVLISQYTGIGKITGFFNVNQVVTGVSGFSGVVKYYDYATSEVSIAPYAGTPYIGSPIGWSGGSITFTDFQQANLTCSIGTLLDSFSTYRTNSGFLSDPTIMLHNGYDVQDYAYIINTVDVTGAPLSMGDYKDMVNIMAHPAGYKMIGRTASETSFGSIAQPIDLFASNDPLNNQYPSSTFHVPEFEFFLPARLEQFVMVNGSAVRYMYAFDVWSNYRNANPSVYSHTTESALPQQFDLAWYGDVTFDMITSNVWPAALASRMKQTVTSTFVSQYT